MDELRPLSHAYNIGSHNELAVVGKPISISGKNAVSGVAGGMASVLLGQPFDLIRVRLQMSNVPNITKTVRDIFVYEGPLAFYKGAAMPLLAVGACVGIQFATFGSFKQALQAHDAHLLPTLLENYLGGGVAGIANSVISGPVEHIRTRLQLQPHGVARLYTGPLDCIRQIVAKAGFRGLFKAYPTALSKEFQAYGCYFAAFEASIASLGSWKGKKRTEMSVLETVPCGALAGVAFWIGCFPIDYVKTKLQNDGFGTEARYKNARAVVISTWREHGTRGFWRGLSPTLVRTSLSSAGCFAV